MTEEQIQTKLWIEREYGGSVQSQVITVREPSEKDDRIRSVSDWLYSRWFGVTKQQIASHFHEYYGDCSKNSAGERLFYRDLKIILSRGQFTRLGDKIVRADRAEKLAG